MLDDKIVLIFGGSGLIGKSVVSDSLENGATVIVAGRTDIKLIDSALYEKFPDNLLGYTVDIHDPASIDTLFLKISDNIGKVDAIVNCTFPRNKKFGAKLEDIEYESFCKNVELHLGSAFLICQKAVDYFSRNGGGNIINFSSVYGIMAPKFEIYENTFMTKEVEYIVCKAAIVHLTKYLAQYVKGKNIRVNCISPGGIVDSQPESFVDAYNSNCLNKGMLDSVDISGTVRYLLSDLSLHVNGQNIIIDDGFSL